MLFTTSILLMIMASPSRLTLLLLCTPTYTFLLQQTLKPIQMLYHLLSPPLPPSPPTVMCVGVRKLVMLSLMAHSSLCSNSGVCLVASFFGMVVLLDGLGNIKTACLSALVKLRFAPQMLLLKRWWTFATFVKVWSTPGATFKIFSCQLFWSTTTTRASNGRTA